MKACIHVLGDAGYVWDADVAHWLRLECGIVGAMVGGVAAFKQQNAVHGLPLELSAEEVTLAVEKGWAELAPVLDTAALAAALGASGRKRARQSAYQYYDEEDEDLDADMADAAAQQQQPAAEPTWRPALASGATFVIPTTVAEAAAANEGRSLDNGSGAADAAAGSAAAAAAAGGAAAAAAAGGAAADAGGAAGSASAAQWTFPSSREERHCYWVFRDLHSRGYRLTGGSKFGADYLVYPGDPTLYHAQFCVRLLPYRQPITPSMMASATRGSHQARKHLLIASVTEDAEEGTAAAASAGAAPSQPARQQEQQQQGQQAAAQQGPQTGQTTEACNGSEAGPLAEQQQEAGSVQLGIRASGVGSRGERYRIHYMTIGPVEGFGG